MNEGPVTIPPAPRRAVNITAEELLNAIQAFLRQNGFTVSTYELFPEEGVTGVSFYGVSENGELWDKERYIFFSVAGRRFRSLTARLGSGPFVLSLKASRTLEEAKRDVGVRLLFDVVARPNPDRSITFLPVKRREGDFVYF